MPEHPTESHHEPARALSSVRAVPTAPKLVAPSHLRAATRRWWVQVQADYQLEDHHVRLLTLAAEAWDRSCQAREALDKFGLTFRDRFDQPHARPEVAIERDSRLSFARLLREIDLDADALPDPRPPRRGRR